MDIKRQARRALSEDRAWNDVTSRFFVPSKTQAVATIKSREVGVLAGVDVARAVFLERDKKIVFQAFVRDGDLLRPGRTVLEARGSLRSLLSAERSALNFLSHLSGVASLTRLFVRAVGRRKTIVLETRKTTPGLRELEKYAVRMGGGKNHRKDLADAVLLKENHLAFFRGALGRAGLIHQVQSVRRRGIPVVMECRDRDEALWALEAGADVLLLDNIPSKDLPGLVRWVRQKAKSLHKTPLLEVSGGVTLENVGVLALSGVDRVSSGALTHSAPALDFCMDVDVL